MRGDIAGILPRVLGASFLPGSTHGLPFAQMSTQQPYNTLVANLPGLTLVPAVAKAALRSSKVTLQNLSTYYAQDVALITSLLSVPFSPRVIFITILIRTASMSCKCICTR